MSNNKFQPKNGSILPQVLVLRALAPVVEPAMDLLRQVWARWRAELWGLDGRPPRIWAT